MYGFRNLTFGCAALLAGAFTWMADSAGAVTVTGTECATSQLEFSSACIGLLEITAPPAGEASLDDINKLDGGGWMLALGAAGLPEVNSGTYTISDPMADYDYAISMKSAASGGTKYFAAYLLSAADILLNLNGDGDLTGMFNTLAFDALNGSSGDAPNLSNSQLWKRCATDDCDDPGTGPSPVPVPAGLPLMLSAIGIGAYMRKRGQKSA